MGEEEGGPTVLPVSRSLFPPSSGTDVTYLYLPAVREQ